MRKYMLFAATFLFAVALLTANATQAQVTVLSVVGSSGVFATTGLAAVTSDPVTGAAPLCGTNFWSGGSSSVISLSFAVDSRNSGIPHEPGTIWVAWDNDTSPTKVCSYLAVSSVTGDRLFLSQGGAGNAKLSLNTAAQYTVGANKVSFAQDNISCATSTGATVFNVDLSESGSTVTVVVHGGGNFSNYFSNGAQVTIAGSPVNGYNTGVNVSIGGVTQLGPTSFTYAASTSGLATDSSGSATATVVTNCPGLPAAVFNAINGQHFTVAFSDIRPEDAHSAFSRATCALKVTDPTTSCMGYGSSPSQPERVFGSYSVSLDVGVDFALFGGTDPITSVPVPTGTIVDVGAVPILYIASNRDMSACGLGNAAFTNVNTSDVQSAYRGITGATQDISAALSSSASGCPTPLHPVEREPFSGAYNSVEWQVVRSERGGQQKWSQENGNVGYPQSNNNLGTPCPSWASTLPDLIPSNPSHPPFGTGNLTQACGNPLNIQTANYSTATPALGPYSGFGGSRTRAIGTDEMVTVVNSTNVSNTIGYALYSLGTFGGRNNVKYVMLDGADPLWPDYLSNPYGAGVFPQCSGKLNVSPPTFACSHAQPTFDGVKSGRYSSWNVIRALYYGPASTCASPFTAVSSACLIQAAQDQANPTNGNVRDYVPVVYCGNATCGSHVQNLTYFRSHYTVGGIAGHNGYAQAPFTSCSPGAPESGGDVAGAIFPAALEEAQLNSIGCTAELTGYLQ